MNVKRYKVRVVNSAVVIDRARFIDPDYLAKYPFWSYLMGDAESDAQLWISGDDVQFVLNWKWVKVVRFVLRAQLDL